MGHVSLEHPSLTLTTLRNASWPCHRPSTQVSQNHSGSTFCEGPVQFPPTAQEGKVQRGPDGTVIHHCKEPGISSHLVTVPSQFVVEKRIDTGALMKAGLVVDNPACAV